MLVDVNAGALDRVLADLRHENAATREDAVKRLQRLVGEAATHATEATGKSEIEEQAEWAKVRRQLLSHPPIADALVALMEDTAVRVRSATALLMGDVESVAAVEALILHLRIDSSPHVRLMCTAALTFNPWTKTPHVADALIAALSDPFDKIVYTSCLALGDIGDGRATEPLRRVLDHPSWNVRYYACEALVQLNAVDERVVAELEALVTLPQAAVHDKLVTVDELEQECGVEGQRSLTCMELLEAARRALEKRTEEPGDAP